MTDKKQQLKNKVSYSSEYISYIENGESAAVFIARDIAKAVPTQGMWIDVLSMDKKERKDNRWDFNSFIVELFPRKTKPVYPKDATKENKKYITWQTAHEDIEKQREQGFKGSRYIIRPRLVNHNKGKYITRLAVWNVTFGRWVPDKWFTSSCEWREKKEPIKAKWEYEISTIEKL